MAETHGPVYAHLGPEGYTTTLSALGHELISDEPASLGGEDKGPTPYDMLLASLGGCIAITLRMYAGRKGWNLETVDVALKHGRIHAEDCAECENKTGMVDRIDVDLKMTGDLTDEQRARLTEIAHRCPVHRTLTSQTVVHVEVG